MKPLQDALGDVLAQALSAVAKERPADPVQFVADFLLRKHEDAKKIQETTTTIGRVIKRVVGCVIARAACV